MSGNLETKYQVKDLGMTLTNKWTTDNNLSTTVDVVDKLIPGCKLSLDTKFAPGTGAKSGAMSAVYKHHKAMVTADIDLGLTGLNASAVMGHKGWLAGYQTSFDLAKSSVTKNNFGLVYATRDCVLHTSLTNGTEIGGSVYQKLSPNLETGVTFGWSTTESATKFGIGAKYVLASGAVVRAKVDNNSKVGLGYQQKLRDGVTVTLSTLINGAKIYAGSYIVGVALEMYA